MGNTQYKDSVTTEGAGYQKTPADEIGSYEASTADLGAKNSYDVNNIAYPVGAVPTPDNSKRKSDVSQLNPGQDSAPNVGNLSC